MFQDPEIESPANTLWSPLSGANNFMFIPNVEPADPDLSRNKDLTYTFSAQAVSDFSYWDEDNVFVETTNEYLNALLSWMPHMLGYLWYKI